MIGCGIVKCLTLGRYPRTIDLRQPEAPDFMLFSAVGMISSVGLIILVVGVLT